LNRVLVTGGAGFIGSHLVAALAGHVEYLTVIDNLSTGREANIPGVRLWVGDITDPSFVADAAAEARPDIIFHLAAQASVAASMRDMVRDAEVNVIGTVNVLRAANQHRSRVIYASTGGAMYGEVTAAPATEKNTVRSIAPYAVSKYCGERYLQAANWYKPERKDGHVMLRFANVYGPRQDPNGEAGVVAIFLNQLLSGKTPTIHGAGAQSRDFVYVSDAVRALVGVAEIECRGVFNVGYGTALRIDSLLLACAEAVGVPWPEPEYDSPRRGDIHRSVLDSAKLRELISWTPRVHLQEGLVLTAEWLRAKLPAEAAS
jgi:UDP-glucose 4-epimerase